MSSIRQFCTFKCWKYVSICTFRCWKYVSFVRFSACKNVNKCTFYRTTFYVKYIRIIMTSRWYCLYITALPHQSGPKTPFSRSLPVNLSLGSILKQMIRQNRNSKILAISSGHAAISTRTAGSVLPTGPRIPSINPPLDLSLSSAHSASKHFPWSGEPSDEPAINSWFLESERYPALTALQNVTPKMQWLIPHIII